MLAALLLIASVFFVFGARIDHLIAVNIHARIREYAISQKNYISAVLESRYALLESFSVFFGDSLITEDQDFDRLTRSLLLAGDFDHVLIIDKDGNYRINSGESGQGINDAGRQLLLEKERAISRPFEAFYHNDEQCVLLSVPLADEENAPVGMLCASYTAQQLGRMLLQESYRDDSFSLLTDKSGNLLFSSSQDHLFIPDEHTDLSKRIVPSPDFFDEALSKTILASMARREDNLYTLTHDGISYVVVQTPLEQNDWFLFCMVPTASLASDYTFITHLRHVQIAIISTILVATALVLIVMLLRERRRLRRENSLLTVRAETDSMTGLLNQATTSSTISAELRQHTDGLLLLIDLDNLKGINDTFGHPVGDRAILILSELMQRIFADAKVIGRIGGDEFMIYLSQPGNREQVRSQIVALQGDMYREMSKLVVEAQNLSLHCSVGAAYAKPGDDFDALYRRADIALYHVKRHGKDGHAFFSETRDL